MPSEEYHQKMLEESRRARSRKRQPPQFNFWGWVYLISTIIFIITYVT